MIRVGDQQQATVCYDTELLRMSLAWTGDWLKFSPARFGLISPPAVGGPLTFATPARPGVSPNRGFDDHRPSKPYGPLPNDWCRWQGFTQHGDRIVIAYALGRSEAQTEVLESPWLDVIGDEAVFTREFQIAAHSTPLQWLLCGEQGHAILAAPPQPGIALTGVAGLGTVLSVAPSNQAQRFKIGLTAARPERTAEQWQRLAQQLSPLSKPDLQTLARQAGPTHWTDEIITRGTRAPDDTPANAPYVLDTLTIPFDNPYRALMFLSGHDFFTAGTAAVCTAHGDVWLVSGIDDTLQQLRWKRFATGLFQPLGLKIVEDSIYVLGRDQLTRLHDLNQDGEADWYENFNNAGQITTNAHEYATCLETDSHGNFYYLRGDSNSATAHDGCLLKINRDTHQLEVFATGFRNANGLSISPDDIITVAPQEGTWTPASAVFQVQRGGFYGAMQSHHRLMPPTTFEPPICWFPRRSDNSSGGQAWVTGNRWGPLQGELLHFSFGTCRMFLIPREQAGTVVQGGSVPFPLNFDSGVMRGRFHPRDGQLYVTGLKGWVSSAVQDGCFQRVRYTGQEVAFPVRMTTFRNGLQLHFTTPLAPELAGDPGSYSLEQWNYRWTGNYGSADYRVSDPAQTGHDVVEVLSATPSPDGRSVFLEIPNLQPVHQLSINYDLQTQSGLPLQQNFTATLNVIPEELFPTEQIQRRENRFALPPEFVDRLQPGVLWTWKQTEKSAVSVSRLATIQVPLDTSPAFGLEPGPFSTQGTAYWRIPARKTYRFQALGAGTVKIRLDDQLLFEGELLDPTSAPIITRKLPAGYHTLTIDYQSPPTGEARLRFLGSPEDAPLDPLWPTELFHPGDTPELLQAQRRQHGSLLMLQHNCAACHQRQTATVLPSSPLGQAPQWPLADNQNPRLTLQSAWVADWILDPKHFRASAHMPRLLDRNRPADRQAAADLAAWLTHSHPSVSTTEASRPEGDVSRGEVLYERFGCLACHRLPELSGDDLPGSERLSLKWVSSKFLPGAIAEFLQQPQRHHSGSRMPDFHLSPSEAADLEAFLREAAPPPTDRASLTELATADPQRGAKLAHALQCVRCHTASKTSQPPLKAWDLQALTSQPARGCLAETPRSAPDFGWTTADRDALHSLFQTNNLSSRFSTTQWSQLLVQELRCTACHDRDGRTAPVKQSLAEEGSGRPPEMWPHLTWTGEKLRSDWMERFLRGEIAEKPRHWVQARMPSFPTYAHALARGLASEHAIPFSETSPSAVFKPDPELAELGRRLTFKSGGLDCRQCHGLGRDIPQGDEGTQFAHGINFSQIRGRLHHDFYMRMILDPTRYDHSSRMPRFSLDGRTTPVKEILGGNATRQFDALWHYLQQVGLQQVETSEPIPSR